MQLAYSPLCGVEEVVGSSSDVGDVCVQRVVVIVAAVFFFKNPISTQSAIFTGVALAGVFAYSQAKRIYGSIKMEKATS